MIDMRYDYDYYLFVTEPTPKPLPVNYYLWQLKYNNTSHLRFAETVRIVLPVDNVEAALRYVQDRYDLSKVKHLRLSYFGKVEVWS
jgi:hypothetical protein